MKTVAVACLLLFPSINHSAAQTIMTPSMDWGNGIYRILAVRPLNTDITPADHPRALQFLERELTPLVIENLGTFAWNSNGTLADYASEQSAFRTGLEILSQSLNKDWSRLSVDRKSIEAEYYLNLAIMVSDIFPVEATVNKPTEPIGWVPIPEDPWTGIIIYAPEEMSVRGTGLTSSPRQALMARILDPYLNPLTDPGKAPDTWRPLIWLPLERREEAEGRVGRRPYRAMARELYGTIPCDLILSLEDSQRIMASESGRQALSDGRIAILIDN